MEVWIVTRGWVPDTEPKTLEFWDGFQEIVGVYSSEEKATEVQEDLFDPWEQDVDIMVHCLEVE